MEDKTLEIVFQELDEVVKKLEGEAVSLEESGLQHDPVYGGAGQHPVPLPGRRCRQCK